MDPEARRHMWEVIAQVSEDRSIIITTHSMEVILILLSHIITIFIGM